MSGVRLASGRLSGRKWLSGRVLAVVGGLVIAVAAALLASVYPTSLYLLYVLLSLLVGAVATSTLIWMLYAWRTPDSLLASRLASDGREAAHSFSLIVPARHEEAVLATTLSRLVGSDHPDFEVLVVVGADDQGTRGVAERVAARHPGRVRVVVDHSWPKSKPKALNTALPYCTGEVTGVFDAEDDVHPALLRRVDQCFQATEADIVQAGVQLMNFRSRWFTVHNVLEYYFWFRSRLHVHAHQGFIPLGGNTVFVRTSILRAVGGWADCLAEDCEIGVRLSALGARTAVFYEPELVTREECPPTVRAFVRQRTRWNQGYLQTLARGYWRRLPLRQSLLGAYILASPYVMALAWLMIPAAIATAVAVKAPIIITLLSFLPLVPMLAMLVAESVGLTEFCRAYGERARVGDHVRLVLGLLFYQGLLAYAAARAVVRSARGVNGWEKTTHLGLHLGSPAEASATPGGRVSELTRRAVTCRSAPILRADDPGPELRDLATDPVGLRQFSPVGTDALAPIPVMSLPASQRSYEHVAVGAALDAAKLGNGHAGIPASHIEQLFGDVGGAPLWTRLDGEEAHARTPRTSAPSPPASPWHARRGEPALRNFVRGAARRPDLILLPALLIVVALVVGTNLTHWPGTQFDEGTYISYAWALQHGRLANYTYNYGHPPVAWLLIYFWTEATGVFGRTVFSVDHGREFMLAVNLVSCSLLYVLARRLEYSRVSAAASVILFALCPLGIFYHRAVLLDNPSIAFVLAAFLLARTPQLRLWAFAASGACFALGVLCKETTLLLFPALLVAVIQNADRRTRHYCVMIFAAFFLLALAMYPLYATLKGELLPGPKHVSMTGSVISQLFTRQATGSVFDPHSQTHAIVVTWLREDPWLLSAALVLSPLTLARRSTRAVALAFLIQAVTVFRPGYLPNMFVIGMLPFAALIVPGGIEALWRWARLPRFPAMRVAARAAVAAMALLAVLFVAPHWATGDRVAMTARLDGPQRTAEQWLVDHVGHDQRLIVTDQYWIYLIEHGYNDQPMPGGFFSRAAVSFWSLDYDSAFKIAFPRGWREFNFIVVDQNMIGSLSQTPSSVAAIDHSRLVASFGRGPGKVQVREIMAAGP